MRKNEINALGINIEDQIDLAALKAASASGKQLVDQIRWPSDKLVGDGRGSKFTLGKEHGDLLRMLVTAYEKQAGRRLPVSAVVRRAIEIAAEHVTDLLLSADTDEMHEEMRAFRSALDAVLNQD